MNLLSPVLAYPQNGAYGLPTDGTLAWNSVSGSNGTYKVSLGTANGTWDIIDASTTTSLSYSYPSLSQGTTYYWKVKTCDVNATCVDSSIYSFTTASAVAGGGSTPVTPAVNNYCPTEPTVPCVVGSGSLSVAYMGCSNIDSANSDCALDQDSFGTSERDFRNDAMSNSYFGYDKALTYELKNTSNGSAYFKVKLGTNASSLITRASTNSYDLSNTIDFGGE